MSDPVIIDGRYELTELLGSGVSGEVWAARQRSVDRSVAVKLLKKMEDERFEVRFATEARAIAMLNHPNIVTLFDYGYEDLIGTHFMVMERVDGQSLVDALLEPIPTAERVLIARDIASALTAAHGSGILHRDLKPENVILASSPQGPRTVKVLDFGLARIRGLEEIVISNGLVEATTTTRITLKGEIQGTPAYMSPEQAVGSLEVGTQTDIYALGVILYELLHGHLPFDHDDAWEIIYSHARDEPEIADSVPSILGDLIRTMMAKEPDERPSADDVVQILDRWAALETELPAALPGDVMIYGDGFVLEEAEEDDSRRGLLLILLILIVLPLGMAVLWLLLDRGTSDPPGEQVEQVIIKEVPVEVEVVREVQVLVPAPPVEAADLPFFEPEVVVSETLTDDEDDERSPNTPEIESTRRRVPKSDGFEEIKLTL